MIYVSCDIETTGLDPDIHDIIEFGAVLEDTSVLLPINELPSFRATLKTDNYTGSAFALSMHSKIFKKIAAYDSTLVYPWNDCIIHPADLGSHFLFWLKQLGVIKEGDSKAIITVAGKNFGSFDLQFLKKLPEFTKKINIRHRILDPSILFINYQEDEVIPALGECKKRANVIKPIFENTIVEHTTVEDSKDVIQLLRSATNNYKK
jgi:oligoribonuclease